MEGELLLHALSFGVVRGQFLDGKIFDERQRVKGVGGSVQSALILD
jgi:hypothetical protein